MLFRLLVSQLEQGSASSCLGSALGRLDDALVLGVPFVAVALVRGW